MFEEEEEEDEDEWLFKNHSEDMNTFTEQEWNAANLRPDPGNLEVARWRSGLTRLARITHSLYRASEVFRGVASDEGF